MTLLQVLVCTHGDTGLDRVAAMRLPQVPGVEYIISCQSQARPIPGELQRDDIRIRFSASSGLSNNRNEAMRQVTASFALFSDDDINLSAEGLQELLALMANDSSTDIFTLKLNINAPDSRKFPANGSVLKLSIRRHFPYSPEIAFRSSSIQKIRLNFSPLMGKGAPVLHSGEENIFIDTALRKGLTIRFFNICIGSHPGASTYERFSTDGELRSRGAVLRLCHSLTFIPRIIRLAVMLPTPTLHSLRMMLEGARYASGHKAAIRTPQDIHITRQQ